MEHRAVLLAFGVLGAALALAAIGSQAPAADPSAKNDGSEKLELVAEEMRVSVIAKATKSVAPTVSENDASLDSGISTTTAILEPQPFSAITVPSLMAMANFSSVVISGEVPTRVVVAAPCAVTSTKPEKPRRVTAAPRALPWKAMPKPAAPAPQVQSSSWLQPSWLRLPWIVGSR